MINNKLITITHKIFGSAGLMVVAFVVANVALAASMGGDTMMKDKVITP